CLEGAKTETTQCGGTIVPRLVSVYPVNRATAANRPIIKSNFDIGRNQAACFDLVASPPSPRTPRERLENTPVHQVANTPQPMGSSIGDFVDGWKIEKYSTQMWAVKKVVNDPVQHSCRHTGEKPLLRRAQPRRKVEIRSTFATIFRAFPKKLSCI